MELMYDPADLATMDPLVLMKNLDHVRMTSRRLSYILQQQVHLYTPEANELREQIDRYVEAPHSRLTGCRLFGRRRHAPRAERVLSPRQPPPRPSFGTPHVPNAC